jgi:hypothetical protein
MDSTFLGMLVGVCLRLKGVSAHRIAITRINPRNLELLKTLGIEPFFQFEDHAQPPAGGADLQSLPVAQASVEQKAAAMLEAHETLACADDRNVCRFKDVIAFLKEDLVRLKAAKASSTPSGTSRD